MLNEINYKELLAAGQTFKNYKALCEHLDEKSKTGNARNAQYKEWECHFDYERNGHKIIIKEVFHMPKKKVDNRSEGNNTVKYVEKIENLILDLLVQDENDGQVFLSRNKLLEALKMVNENYSYGKYNIYKLSKYTNISRKEIDEFYSLSDGMLERNLVSALRGLRRKSLVIWKKVYTVAVVETQIAMNRNRNVKAIKSNHVNEYGDTTVSFQSHIPEKPKLVHKKATFKEEQAILRAEEDALAHFGYEEVRDAFVYGKQEEFYRWMYDDLFEKYNIHMYYMSYEITFNKDSVEKAWAKKESRRLSVEDRLLTQEELNTDVLLKLIENAEKRHSDSLKKYVETRKMIYKNRIPDSYLENNLTLINTLIKYDAEVLKSKEKNNPI